VYTPNSGEKLLRLNWRIDTWDVNFNKYINKLYSIKPVIICGDLNVAHKEIDIKNPEKNKKNPGFTIEERESFTNIIYNNDLIDIFRIMHPTIIKYTYWSYGELIIF